MEYLDLLLNLSLLVSLSIVSSFLEKRWSRHTMLGRTLQGVLFGCVAVVGMLRPLEMGHGIIFDGRTIMISLAALFFGPSAAWISAFMAAAVRVFIGGGGMLMGVLVAFSSAAIGLLARRKLQPDQQPPSGFALYYVGLAVHVAMIALMVTLPKDAAADIAVNIAPYIIVFFPLATVLAGSILSEHLLSRQSAERLQEREAFYAAVMEHLPIGISVNTVVPEVSFTYTNPQFLEIYGISEPDIQEKNSFWHAVYEDSKFREVIQRQVEEDVESGDINRMQWNDIPLKKQGHVVRYISARNTPVPDKDFMISSVWDVTDRVRLQEQLIQAQKMETLGRLAGGIAHDFNNYLSIIFGYAELMLDEVTEKNPLHTNLQEVLHAAERSKDLVQQLLAFARQQTTAPKIIQLNEIIEKSLKMITRLIGEEITCSFTQKHNLTCIEADPSQIEQILTNLCINARDAIQEASRHGAIFIETDEVEIDQNTHGTFVTRTPGRYVMLSVADNGIGMEEDIENMIFEPFFTTKSEGNGSGLGLSTVYGIVKQNKGDISVYSEPGVGTTFKIYFPIFNGEEAIHETPTNLTTLSTGNGELILIIEDELSILTLIEQMVLTLGFSAVIAQNPQEAINHMKTYGKQIRLVLTDVVIPEMNGRQLVEKLKTIHDDFSVLYMSGYTANVIAHKGILDTGVNFIHKPFSKASLSEKIESVLSKKQNT